MQLKKWWQADLRPYPPLSFVLTVFFERRVFIFLFFLYKESTNTNVEKNTFNKVVYQQFIEVVSLCRLYNFMSFFFFNWSMLFASQPPA